MSKELGTTHPHPNLERIPSQGGDAILTLKSKGTRFAFQPRESGENYRHASLDIPSRRLILPPSCVAYFELEGEHGHSEGLLKHLKVDPIKDRIRWPRVLVFEGGHITEEVDEVGNPHFFMNDVAPYDIHYADPVLNLRGITFTVRFLEQN